MDTANELGQVFGGNQLLTALAVLLGICAIIITLGKTLDVVKGWRKHPDDDSVMEKLHNDKIRLDAHEIRIKNLEGETQELHDGMRCTMSGVMALLEHELHNGNDTQMQEASNDINRYLRSKV